MRSLCIPAVLALAACQSSVPFEPLGDRCGSLGYLSMVGGKEDAIQPATFPEGTRIIRAGSAVNGEYRAERLNVHVNEKGRIERISCG